MIDSLRHRGPDGRGEHEWQVGERTVYLGHARLRIIDLSDAGRQPMLSDDGQVALTYNGEIYNFEALRARHLAGERFRSRTDTEVILRLYQKLGIDFVQELNGDFAMALLDKRSATLHLVRDRLGIKPLYCYEGAGVFAFASETKAFAALGLPVTLSPVALQQYLAFKYVPGQRTMHQEVRRVAPGTIESLDLRTNTRTSTRFWSIRRDPDVAKLGYEEAQERLRALLEDAVQSRTIGDVPVGTLFSGGLDSSIIAYFLRDNAQITHYCARKDADDLRREGTTSDFEHASRLAAAWKLPFRPIDIGHAEATREMIALTTRFSDDLIADGSQIPAYLICRAASPTAKVMLSGMGADEIFLGYGGHLLTLLSLYIEKLPGAIGGAGARLLGGIPSGRGAFRAHRRWLRKFGRNYGKPAYRYSAFSIVGDLDSALELSALDPENVTQMLAAAFPPDGDPFEQLAAFELENFLVKNLHYVDRMAMASGVETRVPFLDHRVVEFALSLPREYRLSRLGTGKRILKDAFRDVLPAHIRSRRKAGFGMPLRSVFMNSQKARELLDFEFFASVPFIRADRIPGLLQRHADGLEDNSALLYALATFQEWSRQQDESDFPGAASAPQLQATAS